jgi:uncharacterized protein YjdB
MGRKQLRLIGYGLTIGLIAAFTLAACSTKTPGSTSASTAITTTTSAITSIEVTPNPAPNLAVGNMTFFYAIAHYSNGLSAVITQYCTWASSDTTVATIAQNGSVTGVAAGTSSITSSWSGVTSPPVILAVVH